MGMAPMVFTASLLALRWAVRLPDSSSDAATRKLVVLARGDLKLSPKKKGGGKPPVPPGARLVHRQASRRVSTRQARGLRHNTGSEGHLQGELDDALGVREREVILHHRGDS